MAKVMCHGPGLESDKYHLATALIEGSRRLRIWPITIRLHHAWSIGTPAGYPLHEAVGSALAWQLVGKSNCRMFHQASERRECTYTRLRKKLAVPALEQDKVLAFLAESEWTAPLFESPEILTCWVRHKKWKLKDNEKIRELWRSWSSCMECYANAHSTLCDYWREGEDVDPRCLQWELALDSAHTIWLDVAEGEKSTIGSDGKEEAIVWMMEEADRELRKPGRGFRARWEEQERRARLLM